MEVAGPAGVYTAIHAVLRDIGAAGIAKDRRNAQQGYNFRGIDEIYNALNPLLAQHGLMILPRMVERTVQERQTAKGGTLFYATVAAEFDFVAVADGSVHVLRTYGEAMDSADKATNKAMSAAYKYACMQAFAIPTEPTSVHEDADASTPEPVRPVQRVLTEEEREDIYGCADEAIAEWEAGNEQGAYEKVLHIQDPMHKRYLWQLLETFPALREAIQRFAAADRQATT